MDVTNVDSLGKSNLHPIYILIGNIKNWKLNKSDAKQLLKYFSILETSNNSDKKSDDFKNAACETFHKSLKVLLNSLLNDNSINLTLNDKTI